MRSTIPAQPCDYLTAPRIVGGKFKMLAALLSLVLAGLALSEARGQSGNLLQNGNFNTAGPVGWTSWSWGNGWGSYIAPNGNAYDGTAFINCGCWGEWWSGGGGWNQVVPAFPGITYTLSCVAASENWDYVHGRMSLIFLDSTNGVIVENDNWVLNYAETYPWTAGSMTNTAPAGTVAVKVEFAGEGRGAAEFDNAYLSSDAVYPTISNLSPDGTLLMTPGSTLSFTAASTARDITGVQVVINGVDVSSSLAITGASNSKNVTYTGLTSNQTYNVTVKVTDSLGIAASKSLTFDTFSPSYYTVEAEDYDYAISDGLGGLISGQFIAEPQTNAYLNLSGQAGIDYNDVTTGTAQQYLYRPGDTMGTDHCGDVARLQYVGTSGDYNIGWFDNGEWLNYTRNYPAGTYNVYARIASPGASTVTLSRVTSGLGTTNQTTTALGTFSVTGGQGWGMYQYVPLKDANGNLVKVSLSGRDTLRITTGGNCNFNFLMFAPANNALPTLSDIYPNGSTLMQATNTFAFTVNSVDGVSPSSIGVRLSVTNVVLHSTTNLTSANGLTVGSVAGARAVTYAGLVPNAQYTAVITATNVGGNTLSSTIRFDTYAPVMSWEAEDWDYNSGQFMDNPAVDAYYALAGVEGVDFHDSNALGTRPYRTNDTMSAAAANDTARVQYAGTNDYAVGYFTTGEWINYTRTFPAGTYNVYGRFSAGGGTSTVGLSTVNGSTVTALGTFSPNTGGWNTYTYTPLRDAYNNLVAVTLNGKTTLRVTRPGGPDANVNFFMLLPAITGLPTITQVSPMGMLQSTNKLQFVANAAAGIASSNIVVQLNGVAVSNLSLTGGSTTWNASCGLAPSTAYSAVITVTDNQGQVASTTWSFDTFSPTAYTWEAEDYDYNGGKFLDNPQVDMYLGQTGTAEVDYHKASTGGNQVYRLDTVGTEECGDALDAARPQYVGTGNLDYDVGNTGTGDWWNYTRTYPAGKFNVYLRAARGAGGTAPMGLERVTTGQGTSSQTTMGLGSFSVPATGAWQSYAWVPLKDGSGSLAVVPLGGTHTLRLTDGGANLNFLLLSPAVALDAVPSAGKLNLSFGTQSGFNYTVLYKNSLSDSTWTELSTVAGDDAVHTVSPAMSGPSRFYRLQVH